MFYVYIFLGGEGGILTQPMDPEKKKFERLIFPTKYVIQKSWESLATGQVSILSNPSNILPNICVLAGIITFLGSGIPSLSLHLPLLLGG